MRNTRVLSCSVAILLVSAACMPAATVIDVGSIAVLANQDGQPIDIMASVPEGSGPDLVTGLNLRVRLGDGIGPLREPSFSLSSAGGRGVDFAGAIWDGPPTTTAGSVLQDAPQYLQASVAFNAASTTVPAMGRIARIYVDTRGIEEGTYDLQLAMTGEIGRPTQFLQPGRSTVRPLDVTIFDGTLNVLSVIPEPSAATLAVLSLLGILQLRRTRR